MVKLAAAVVALPLVKLTVGVMFQRTKRWPAGAVPAVIDTALPALKLPPPVPLTTVTGLLIGANSAVMVTACAGIIKLADELVAFVPLVNVAAGVTFQRTKR